MKKVIIVDDLDFKRLDIKESLKNILGENTIFIECEYRGKAIREIMALADEINSHQKEYLLVLDMCFPVLSDMMPERDMGLDFLYYLKRRKINIPVIMCSSDKIDEELLKDYDNVLGTVEYDSFVWLKPLFEEFIKEWLGDEYEI